jgi:AGZA family xanthine/uracil permease-like MFS transporter
MLDAKRDSFPRAQQALLADAIGTTAEAVLGTSTVTSYVESASGVDQGGPHGAHRLVTALLFLAALFFSPLVSIVPACATAPALILVGIFMMMGLRELDFDDWTDFVPACVALLVMPFSYSIAHGIEFGIISFVVLKLATGKAREASPLMLGLCLVFLAKEIFV